MPSPQYNKALQDLKNFRSKMDPVKIRTQIADAISKDILTLLDKEFETSRDPDGRSWKSRKDGTRDSLLIKSGALRRGWKVIPRLSRIDIINTQDYAKYHQSGTRNMPSRLLVKLSKTWVEYLTLSFHRRMKKYLGF